MRKLLILCFILLLPAKVWGLSIDVETDRTTLSLAETLRLSVSTSGGDFRLPELEDFDVLGRSSSTNISIVNGEFSKTHVQQYQLKPKRTGELTIPALSLTFGNETASSEPLSIHVTEAPRPDASKDDYFITTLVSNPRPFVGEQFSVTYNIHLGGRLSNAELTEPDFQGFTFQKLEPRETRTVVNDRHFVLVSVTYVLTPLGPGEKTISPVVLQGDAIKPGARWPASPFDHFFDDPFSRSRDFAPIAVASEQPRIDVRPLPEFAGYPAFSGLVGQFELTAEPRSLNVNTAETATLTVTLRGKGNLPDASRPELVLPEGLKAYPDQDQADVELTAQGHRGSKIFRWALVPTRPGNYELPELALTYFDPKAESFRTLNTGSIHVAAAGTALTPSMATTQSGVAQPGAPAEAVKITGHDILPLQEDLSALADRGPMPWPWFWGMLALPVALYPAIIILRRRLLREAGLRQMLAMRVRDSLKAAETETDPGERLGLLRRALVSAALARMKRSGEALTAAEASLGLREAGVTPEAVDKATGLLERLEALRYGGRTPSPDDLDQLTREVRDTTRRLSS